MTFKFALFAATAALSLNAQAITTDWGSHNPLEVAAAMTPIGAFEDTYLFTLSESNSIFSTAVANNLTSVLGITDGMVHLYKEAGAVDTAIGSFHFDGGTGSISHSFGSVAAGAYYYTVDGMGTGSLGGFYTISSTVSAVPEPGTLVLALTGLSVVGFIGRRRRP
jgi:hypothetical protein